jgi:capsular exopolysaccharide synthesis family protein
MFNSTTPTARKERHLISFLDPHSFEAEQYRRLRQRIDTIAATQTLQVIAVTSAIVGDGKTLTSVNLAAALARKRDSKVLLIDGDLRRPSVAGRLGLEPQNGGFAAALDEADSPLSKFVQRVPDSTLSVLLGGTPSLETYETLTSPRLTALLSEARGSYDYVIIDTPPTIPVPDSGLLRPVVDGYLMVVSSRSTPRKLVGEALGMLEEGMVIGLVFNRDDHPLFGFYRSHYRHYFNSYVRSVREQ